MYSLCANTEGIAKAAANGARSLLWWAVKQEEKKGKWDLMHYTPYTFSLYTVLIRQVGPHA
jgi:hypothetical protein